MSDSRHSTRRIVQSVNKTCVSSSDIHPRTNLILSLPSSTINPYSLGKISLPPEQEPSVQIVIYPDNLHLTVTKLSSPQASSSSLPEIIDFDAPTASYPPCEKTLSDIEEDGHVLDELDEIYSASSSLASMLYCHLNSPPKPKTARIRKTILDYYVAWRR